MKTEMDWLLKLLRSPQMTMTDDTKHKDKLTAAAPRMLAALEVCLAYMCDEFPFPTREEAQIAAEIAIAPFTSQEVFCLGVTPTTITTHHADGRVTVEEINPSSDSNPSSDWNRPEISLERVEKFLASFESSGLLFRGQAREL